MKEFQEKVELILKKIETFWNSCKELWKKFAGFFGFVGEEDKVSIQNSVSKTASTDLSEGPSQQQSSEGPTQQQSLEELTLPAPSFVNDGRRVVNKSWEDTSLEKITEQLKKLRDFLNDNKVDCSSQQQNVGAVNLSEMCAKSKNLINILFGDNCLEGDDEIKLQGGLIFQGKEDQGTSGIFIKFEHYDDFKKNMSELSKLFNGENAIENFQPVNQKIEYFKKQSNSLDEYKKLLTTQEFNFLGKVVTFLEGLNNQLIKIKNSSIRTRVGNPSIAEGVISSNSR